jgi:hypothetical protein
MKNIYKALADFQNEVPVIHEETKGYNYTYSNLNTIFNVIKPLLKTHGLGFTQLLDGNNLKTIIFHIDSGETLESSVEIPQDVKLSSMNVFQVMGSAITYYRRYSLSAALGLITDKDIDACGEEKKEVKKPQFTLDNFAKALAAKASIEMIKKKYTISAEIEKDYLLKLKK